MIAEFEHSVLLVEDSIALATTFSAHLEKQGLTTQVSHTAADALDALKQRDVSLVLLDLQLPDRDGLELLHDIREMGDATKVIVVTSDASADRAVKAMQMGAQDYLVKPVTPDRLMVT